MPDLTPHNIELIVHSQDRVGLTTAVNNPIKVEFQYNPEALVLPQFTNTMEMGYFFYSTEPFAVYIHSTENDMTIEMTLFDPIACDNSDPSPIHDMMSFLEILSLPRNLGKGKYLPPPRVWVAFTPPGNLGSSDENRLSQIGDNLNPNNPILCVVTAVAPQLIAACPSGKPRIMRIGLTLKQILYPQRTVTGGDFLQ